MTTSYTLESLARGLENNASQHTADSSASRMFRYYAGIVRKLAAEDRTLRDALAFIRDSKHCAYEANGADRYGTGVTDGHRYCANVARAALDGEPNPYDALAAAPVAETPVQPEWDYSIIHEDARSPRWQAELNAGWEPVGPITVREVAGELQFIFAVRRPRQNGGPQ